MKKLLIILAGIALFSTTLVAQGEIWADSTAPATIRAAVNAKFNNITDTTKAALDSIRMINDSIAALRGDIGSGGTTILTDLTGTAWRVPYTNVSGNVTELPLGAAGTYLMSNGAALAPSFATPAGSGDVVTVGTPANNQVGVWTGDGTLEGTSTLIHDGTSLTINGDTALVKGDVQSTLTNSAGLAAALSDETGTGLAVFATSPTFTTSIQLGSTIIDETELRSIDGASGEAFDIDTTVWLLADTVVLASFNASDSLNTSFFYGSFYNGGSDTLVVTEMRAVLQGTSPSVAVDIEWHATFASVSAVGLNTTPPTITSTTTGDSDTTFDNAEIPPGVWVWCKTPTVTTEPTYMSVTLLGYRKNSTY